MSAHSDDEDNPPEDEQDESMRRHNQGAMMASLRHSHNRHDTTNGRISDLERDVRILMDRIQQPGGHTVQQIGGFGTMRIDTWTDGTHTIQLGNALSNGPPDTAWGRAVTRTDGTGQASGTTTSNFRPRSGVPEGDIRLQNRLSEEDFIQRANGRRADRQQQPRTNTRPSGHPTLGGFGGDEARKQDDVHSHIPRSQEEQDAEAIAEVHGISAIAPSNYQGIASQRDGTDGTAAAQPRRGPSRPERTASGNGNADIGTNTHPNIQGGGVSATTRQGSGPGPQRPAQRPAADQPVPATGTSAQKAQTKPRKRQTSTQPTQQQLREGTRRSTRPRGTTPGHRTSVTQQLEDPNNPGYYLAGESRSAFDQIAEDAKREAEGEAGKSDDDDREQVKRPVRKRKDRMVAGRNGGERHEDEDQLTDLEEEEMEELREQAKVAERDRAQREAASRDRQRAATSAGFGEEEATGANDDNHEDEEKNLGEESLSPNTKAQVEADEEMDALEADEERLRRFKLKPLPQSVHRPSTSSGPRKPSAAKQMYAAAALGLASGTDSPVSGLEDEEEEYDEEEDEEKKEEESLPPDSPRSSRKRSSQGDDGLGDGLQGSSAAKRQRRTKGSGLLGFSFPRSMGS